MLALALSPLAAAAAYPYPFLDPSLSDDARIADLLPRVPLQTKIDTLQTSHQAGIPGSGVPASPGYIVLPEYTIETYSTSECLHGYCSASNMTVFAQSITLAASFNAPLLRQVGAKIGEEARAVRNAFEATEQFPNKTATPNGLACFSPQINIVRVRSCPTPSQPGPPPPHFGLPGSRRTAAGGAPRRHTARTPTSPHGSPTSTCAACRATTPSTSRPSAPRSTSMPVSAQRPAWAVMLPRL